jgi:peptide-methionine (S)-S-oxide reductase
MGKEVAVFGMGCFWKPQVIFEKMKGVLRTEVGYMGGDESKDDLSYKDVCTGRTGHAEVVRIEFDSSKVSFKEMLDVFWENHNPTTKNRQGFNFGSQYRSVIFFLDNNQRKIAEKSLSERQKIIGKKKIVTDIVKAGKYFKAEEYHQDYLKKRGKNVC